MKKQNLYKAPPKFNCKPPALFSIPLSDYSDEMNKKRDKTLFIKMKELEKKTQQLKENMELLSKKHSFSLQLIQEMIAASCNLNYGHKQRKIK